MSRVSTNREVSAGRESVVQALVNAGYGERQAKELLSFALGEAQDKGFQAGRHAGLNEAIEAARSEYLRDDTGTAEDEAYNQGVTDAVAAIGALLETAVSGGTAPVHQPEAEVEFGIRAPGGDVVCPTTDRAAADDRLARCRDSWPTAALMQRTATYSPWTEVQ